MQDTAVASPTPEAAPAATPATTQEPVSTQSGTATANGSDAGKAAPSEETFFNGDPNSLPPELKQAYTNMLKDYKSKTQSIADVRKKAQAYDQVSKDQRFVDYWNGLSKTQKADIREQKAEVEKTLGQKITDQEFTKAFENKDSYLAMQEKIAQMAFEKSQKQIEKLEQQLSVKEAADTVESFATEVGKDGKPVRPDFFSLDEDQLITGYLNVNPPESKSQKDYVSKLNEAYGWAKQVSNKYYEKGRMEALARIQQKASNSTEPPTTTSKGAYTGPKIPTVAQAIELAKKGQRVVRDD